MIDALIELPTHLRTRLVAALETGQLASPFAAASLRSALGPVGQCDELTEALQTLVRMGMTGPACAAWIRTVAERASRRPRPDLVWTGPEVPGLHSRNTRRVYEELLGSAEHSIWASSYAFFDGPKAFEILAKRMDQVSDLRVTLFLNIQRRKGDTSSSDALVRRFADRFWGTDWPGTSRPRVYFDPRSIELDGPSASSTPKPSWPTTRRYS